MQRIYQIQVGGKSEVLGTNMKFPRPRYKYQVGGKSEVLGTNMKFPRPRYNMEFPKPSKQSHKVWLLFCFIIFIFMF